MADKKFASYGDKRFEFDAGMTLEQAKEIMARHFPELADPQVDTKKEGGDTVYVFSKKAGRKGARNGTRARSTAARTIARRLARLKPAEIVPARVVSLVLRAEAGQLPAWPAGIPEPARLAHDLEDEARRVVVAVDGLSSVPSAAKPIANVLL